MPELDGIEATRILAVADVADPAPIVVITTFYLDEYVRDALEAGARGFLPIAIRAYESGRMGPR